MLETSHTLQRLLCPGLSIASPALCLLLLYIQRFPAKPKNLSGLAIEPLCGGSLPPTDTETFVHTHRPTKLSVEHEVVGEEDVRAGDVVTVTVRAEWSRVDAAHA